LLLTVAILQTSAMPSLSLSGVMPDLMLLVVVSWSLLRGTREALLWALGGGLLLELLSGGPPGAMVVSLALSGVVTGMGELNLFRDSVWLPLVAGLLATGLYDLSYWVVLQVSGRSGLGITILLQVMAASLVLNALVMYPTYWAMRWLNARAGQG